MNVLRKARAMHKDTDDSLEVAYKAELDKRHIFDFMATHEIPQEVFDVVIQELDKDPDKFVHQLENGKWAWADRVQERMLELRA